MKIKFFIHWFKIIILNQKPVLVIFIGDLVLETLHNKYREWTRKSDLLYIHTDMSQVKMYEKFKKLKSLYVGDTTKNNCGKRDFDNGRAYAEKHDDQIFSEIDNRKYRKIVVVSTLKYSSACGISTELYARLIQKCYDIFFIGIKPFIFEGINSFNNYEKAIKILSINNFKNIDLIDPNDESNNLSFPSGIIGTIINLIDKQLILN
jgi:cell division GTPase FtsZ